MASHATRARKALRAVFSIEGLVTLLVGGAVWTIGSALITQFTDFRLGPALGFGAGVGILAAALFIWTVVRPAQARTEDRSAQATERMTILRNSARNHLRRLIEEGRLWTGAGLAPDFARRRGRWQARAHDFVTTAFGRPEADRVMSGTSVRDQIDRLDQLLAEIDRKPLHQDYRGWSDPDER